MLDVIKELIPLLEGAKDGVVWLVLAYFGLMAGKAVLIAGVVLFIANSAAKLIMTGLGVEAVTKNSWNMYQWDTRDGGKIDAYFTKAEFQSLLREIASPSGRVSGGHIERAIETLRRAKPE